MSFSNGYGQHAYGYSATEETPTASEDNLAPLRPTKKLASRRSVPASRKKLWVPALTIVISLLAGCIFALGHHIYYSSLSGKAVDSTTVLSGLQVYDQKWASHVGTALAFLAKFFFTMSVGAAYVETLWRTARRPLGLSVSGLDKSFGLLGNPLNFLSADLLASAQLLILIAVVSWLVPIVTVFTPGSLTVATQFVNGTVSCSIPALNLSSDNAATNLGSYTHVGDQISGSLLAPSQTMKKLATTTLLGGTYTSPASPCASGASVCTYSTSFAAPYLECSDPVGGNYTGDLNFKQTGGTTLLNATYIPSSSSGDQLIVAWEVTLDVESSAEVYVVTCATMNATYMVDVQHTAGTHTVEVSSIVVNGVINTDPSTLNFQVFPLTDPSNSVITRSQILSAAVIQSLEDVLAGSIVASDSSSPSLFLTVNQTMVAMSDLGQIDEDGRTFSAAPNMSDLLSSFVQNVAIGLMASNISDTVVETTCVESATRNMYLYHPMTLWPPYVAAAVAALLTSAIGLFAIWSNQTTLDTTFTTMIEVTRNSALDAVVAPEEDPGQVRLRYGLINDGGEERMAFAQLGEYPLAGKEHLA